MSKKADSENAEPQKSTTITPVSVLIIVAVIGAIATIVAALIGKIPTDTSPTLTSTSLPCSSGFFACVFPQAVGAKTFEVKRGTNVKLTVDELSKECSFTSEYGVKLTYSISQKGSNNASWGIEWKSTLGNFDASNFTNLTFAVRGKTGGEKFIIGMKDIKRDEDKVTLESKDYVTVSSSKWEKVSIPISNFTYLGITVDPALLENVSFSFDERHGSGSICLDDIAFE